MKTYNNYTLGECQQEKAMEKYNAKFDNLIYAKATSGKSTNFCIRLQNDAIALCGGPHDKLSNMQYNQAATDFLKLFCLIVSPKRT